MKRGRKLGDRVLSVAKSEAEEQEQLRLVDSPEPELESAIMSAGYVNEGADLYDKPEGDGGGGDHPKKVKIDRSVLTLPEIYPKYSSSYEGKFEKKSWRHYSKYIKCKPKETLYSLVPITYWLPHYDWKNISFDLVAGFVVAVLNIPQGMAYAMLGNLPAIVGIYMAFIPVIVYAILGTSRHISMGTFAVVCLMSGKAAVDFQSSHSDKGYTVLEITTALAFTVAIWQTAMGILRLGALSLLLNTDLVSGFTTGAAVHVFTSQVKSLLGLQVPKRNGIFKIIWSYIDFGKNIEHANISACIISVITVSVLLVYNELLKPYWSKKVPFPLPLELITIVVGTLISKYCEFEANYNTVVVGEIPTGLPAPELPNFTIVTDIFFPDGLIIAVVAYAICVSMAKMFATKHGYAVQPNQELLAQGSSNLVGSFFSCGPIAASMSRSLIQEQVGGRTQLTSIVSSCLLVFVLLWIGPFFEDLPTAVLSSIIVVALKGMFLQVSDLKATWKVSKINSFVWICTFLATVVLDIEYGLMVGVALSILTLLWRSNSSHFTILGVHKGTELYVGIKGDPQARELPSIKIVKYTGNLNFTTAESFSDRMLEIIPIDAKKKKKLPKSKPPTSTLSREKITEDVSGFNGDANVDVEKLEWIILDFSSLCSIDPQASKALKDLCKKYAKEGITVLLAGCAEHVLQVMRINGVVSQLGSRHIFPGVHDAVINCGSTINVSPVGDHHSRYNYNSGSESDDEVAYQELESNVHGHSTSGSPPGDLNP